VRLPRSTSAALDGYSDASLPKRHEGKVGRGWKAEGKGMSEGAQVRQDHCALCFALSSPPSCSFVPSLGWAGGAPSVPSVRCDWEHTASHTDRTVSRHVRAEEGGHRGAVVIPWHTLRSSVVRPRAVGACMLVGAVALRAALSD
jgi:hypothetical protein